MMPLARRWFNFVADYHRERMLDHARRRDRALRKLEQLERRELQRQVDAAMESPASVETHWRVCNSRPHRLPIIPSDVH